jgi:hypothetical protein
MGLNFQQKYMNYLNEYVDERDDEDYWADEEITFDDPTGAPVVYAATYEVKRRISSGFGEDEVLNVKIIGCEMLSNDGEGNVIMEITKHTNPSLSTIEDWITSHVTGESRLSIY